MPDIKAVNMNLKTTFCLLTSVLLLLSGCSFTDVVKEGTVSDIEQSIKKGADVNKKDSHGETPLITAIVYHKDPVAVSKLLLASGAQVNTPNSNGYTPLHCAVILSDPRVSLELTTLLVKNGAQLNACGGYDKATPLMSACGNKSNISVIRFLIENGAQVQASDSRNETPLHRAAAVENNSEVMRLLIEHGADVNAGSPSNTPLHRAAYMGASRNTLFLIQNGAHINSRGNISEDKTPLELAIDNKQFDTARILVENGADINSTTYYFFQPFRFRKNSQSYSNKLVHGDVNRIQFEKMTPIHRTITHNNYAFTEYLLQKGAKLNIDAHFGGYPLDFSVYLDYYNISELLLRHKAPCLFADIYFRDAVENGNCKKAELLLRAGAHINKIDSTFYNTPLQIASAGGNIEMVKLLLAHGADKSIKNGEGKTAAECTQNREIRDLLLK